jgi:hypothetical protein
LRAATNGYNGNIDDGLLLDSYPPIRAGPGRTPEQFHEDCLRALARAWADGSLTGLALAIRHCQRCGRLLPDWAATVILQLLGKPGRLARLAKADRWNRIHYTRWDMVRDLQDRWQEPRLAEKYLSTWAATYAYVSEKLAGTEAAGEPDTIKKSYRLVEALFRVGKGARFRS